MFSCAIRTVNQIKNRAILNASASLILFNNEKFEGFKEFIKSYWFDFTMILKDSTVSGTRVQQASVYMIESSLDKIDFKEWFRYFELDDSIGSWHLISMIHNWMCLVKISEPGKDSEYFKRQYILRMQEDLRARINALGVFPSSDKNRFINECHYSFNAAMIAFDEGLINTDRELAASLWRSFFQKKCTDYTKLEVLVQYIRVQLQHLATIKKEDLFHKHIEWKKFDFPK